MFYISLAAASAGYPRSVRVNRTRHRTWHIIRGDLAGCRGAPVKKITLSRRGGFVRFRYSRRGTKWPGVGECPVPFVFATCLKTSPSCCSRLLLFPCACVFTKRKRTRATEAAGTGGNARSFDSTAFLPIRQTFDSFTWEPRNSSWRLSLSFSLPFSSPPPHPTS